jgi:hypothetical protein
MFRKGLEPFFQGGHPYGECQAARRETNGVADHGFPGLLVGGWRRKSQPQRMLSEKFCVDIWIHQLLKMVALPADTGIGPPGHL